MWKAIRLCKANDTAMPSTCPRLRAYWPPSCRAVRRNTSIAAAVIDDVTVDLPAVTSARKSVLHVVSRLIHVIGKGIPPLIETVGDEDQRAPMRSVNFSARRGEHDADRHRGRE